MAITIEQRKVVFEKYNFKLLLQALACFIFISSCALITFGLINATFIPLDEKGNSTSLVTLDAKNYCDRLSGVYLGIPGLIIGPLGLLLIGLLIPKQWALRLAIFHLVLCILGLIFGIIVAKSQVCSCLHAQSLQLKEYYEKEEARKLNYQAKYAWQNERVYHEFPERQLPLATYVIIAMKSFILVAAITQIAAYILSVIIISAGLGIAAWHRRNAPRNAQAHETEALQLHHGKHTPKE